MIDELQILSNTPSLQFLLGHYAACAVPDRTIWHPRQMEIDGVGLREITRLHGKLIAYGWLEQNTGFFNPMQTADPVPSSYRITRSGMKAWEYLKEAVDSPVAEHSPWLDATPSGQ